MMDLTTYCSCGCGVPVTDAQGAILLPAQTVDHFLYDVEGDLDSIELFHRACVIGRTFRNREGFLYVVRPDGDVVCRHAGTERALSTAQRCAECGEFLGDYGCVTPGCGAGETPVRCTMATEVCEGMGTDRRQGRPCCGACAAEYDKAQYEYDRERAGDQRAK
jgi:hypothetical protein